MKATSFSSSISANLGNSRDATSGHVFKNCLCLHSRTYIGVYTKVYEFLVLENFIQHTHTLSLFLSLHTHTQSSARGVHHGVHRVYSAVAGLQL